MQNSQLASFIERVNSDPQLKQRIQEAERAAARDAIKLRHAIDGQAAANIAAVTKIAEDAGYDITGTITRPDELQLTPTAQELDQARCYLTCCWLATSEWTTEPFSLTGTGGPP